MLYNGYSINAVLFGVYAVLDAVAGMTG